MNGNAIKGNTVLAYEEQLRRDWWAQQHTSPHLKLVKNDPNTEKKHTEKKPLFKIGAAKILTGQQKALSGITEIKRSKREKTGFTAGDFFLIFFCLAGAAIAIYFFWRDLNGTLAKTNAVPVGTVRLKDKVVQRHFGDRLAWDQLRNGSPLYTGDVIRSADLSGVVLVLESGDEIELGENSLIQLFGGKDGTKIDFSGGNINVKTGDSGKALTLVSGANQIEVASGAVLSAASDSGNGINLQMVEGEATLATADGVQRIDAGNTANVSSSGEVSSGAYIALLTPIPGQQIVVQSPDEVPVYFSWNRVNTSSETEVRFEVASDRRFMRIVESHDNLNISAIDTYLPPGSYWWRVYPAAGNGEKPVGNKFTITYTPPQVQHEIPTNEPIFSFEPIVLYPGSEGFVPEFDPLEMFPDLTWKGQGAARLRLTLVNEGAGAANPLSGGIEVLAFEDSGISHLRIPRLTEGNYRWRIDAQSSDGQNISSKESASFRFKSYSLLAAPSNLRPASPHTMGTVELRQSRRLSFSWNSVSGASAYIFTVRAQGQAASSPSLITTDPMRQTNYTIEDLAILDAGTFIWQVEAIRFDAAGNIERRGNKASGQFIIDLNRLQAPSVTNPGVLYGN